MALWGSLTNSCEKKRSEKPRRKERYKHLNAEFQRISRRDKKAFLPQPSMQRNRGKQQNWKDQESLQENQRHQGKFSCKYRHTGMDTVKGRNGMNLTEAEDIKKRCQEYTEDSAIGIY